MADKSKNTRRGNVRENSRKGSSDDIPSNVSELTASELRIVDALEARLAVMLDIKFAELETALSKRVEAVEEALDDHSSRLAAQELKIKQLEDKIAKKDLETRRDNFIIKGIKEDENIMDSISKISEAIGVGLGNEMCQIKQAFRLGQPRPNGSPRPVLVKSNQSVAYQMVVNGKKLRASNDFKKVYIDRDLPSATAKALSNLRNWLLSGVVITQVIRRTSKVAS